MFLRSFCAKLAVLIGRGACWPMRYVLPVSFALYNFIRRACWRNMVRVLVWKKGAGPGPLVTFLVLMEPFTNSS